MPNPESRSPENVRSGAASEAAHRHTVADEARLFEFMDNRLPPGEAAAFEAHRDDCANCRALEEQWQQLDVEFVRDLPRPALTSDFAANLWRRLQSGATPDPQLSRERWRARVETELRESWLNSRRRFLRDHVPLIADCLGYAAAATVVGYYTFGLGARALVMAATFGVGAGPYQGLNVALIFSLILGLVCLGFAGRRFLGRWWSML